jgi:glutathione S-transferase
MRTIWGRRNSFNVQKVLWLADELGLAYEHVPAGGSFGGLESDEFRARNPHRRVPVLQDDEVVLWESHAILRYLGARYGNGAVWSSDPAIESLSDRWVEWSSTTLLPAFTRLFWGFFRTPEHERNAAAVEKALSETASGYAMLDEQLALHPYIAGNHLTLADIAAGASMYRWYNLEIERPDLPHLDAWYRRLQTRPAYQTNVMISFEELRARSSF